MSEHAFEVAGGSVLGSDHRRAARNGQDGFRWIDDGALIAGVVCDGCGSSAHPEVGAKLGAAIVLRQLTRMIGVDGDLSPGSPLWVEVAEASAAHLRRLVAGLGTAAVRDYLLFTIVGFAMTREQTAVFSLGDGVVAVNGRSRVLGPFPGNAPPYLGYSLFDGPAPRFDVEQHLPTDAVESLLVATDGAAPLTGDDSGTVTLAEFWSDPRYFRNPDAVRRRLFLLTRPPHALLGDDTTIIVVRRKVAA